MTTPKTHLVAATVFVSLLVVVLAAVAWYLLAPLLLPQPVQLMPGQNTGFRNAPNESDYYIPDAIAGHVHKPHAVWDIPWKEHPDGNIRMAVNNIGFREDADMMIQEKGQAYRILVTGDSHMDGVVNNSESFANRLEVLLNQSSDNKSSDNESSDSSIFEVFNGGTGYYGPYNYAGFLKKFLHLQPDMFVVVLYIGNDFMDAIQTAAIRQQIHIPERPEGYTDRLQQAAAQNPGAIAQGLNQAYFFKTYPELQTAVVEIAYQQFLDIAHLCSDKGIELLVLTLPTKMDMPAGSTKPSWENTARTLGLSAEDIESNKHMGRLLLEKLSMAGVAVLDPFDVMTQSPPPLFWEADYHLNHSGHDRLAQIVFEYLDRSVLANRSPGRYDVER